MSIIETLARPEILSLTPYAHAAWLPSLRRLHANEAPWRPPNDATQAGLNRYPEPQPKALIALLAELYDVPSDCVLATRGADEAIDLLSRIFLRAGRDAILQPAPTFGMYQVSAHIQGADVVEVALRAEDGWSLDPDALLECWQPAIKLVYLCSPNNPTGNSFDPAAVETVCQRLEGKAIVVLDEAYIEWSKHESLTPWLKRFEGLAILRTLSKAHALAGARLGVLLAAPPLIDLARRVIPPYALAQPTIEIALSALAPDQLAMSLTRRGQLLVERDRLSQGLAQSPLISKVWPTDANFVLVDCIDADRVMSLSLAAGLIVRDMRAYPGLKRSIRVSVGSTEDIDTLLQSVSPL